MKCRIDRFIWAVRLAKTRTKATELVSKGKILVNDTKIKPSREVKPGDKITVIIHSSRFTYTIFQLLDRRVGAKLVNEYIIDITAPEEVEKLRLYMASQKVYREKGEGKPSKKERRDLDDFLDNW